MPTSFKTPISFSFCQNIFSPTFLLLFLQLEICMWWRCFINICKIMQSVQITTLKNVLNVSLNIVWHLQFQRFGLTFLYSLYPYIVHTNLLWGWWIWGRQLLDYNEKFMTKVKKNISCIISAYLGNCKHISGVSSQWIVQRPTVYLASTVLQKFYFCWIPTVLYSTNPTY